MSLVLSPHDSELLRPPVGLGGSETTLVVSTTWCSPLHRLATRDGRPIPAVKAYLVAICVTYLPLLIAASISKHRMMTRTSEVLLPFLYDWNVAFMFLLSFPSIVVLLLSDDAAIRYALLRVQQDGVVIVASHRIAFLIDKWQRAFRVINVAGYTLGICSGVVIALFNYDAYAKPHVGYWIASDGRLLPSGYVFLVCVFFFYGVIPLVVLRTIGVSIFLKDVVADSQLQLLPFHPDRCGGLRPVGRLGLRTQYALSIFGLNLVSLVAISFWALNISWLLYALMAAGAITYLIVGPIVFMGPLLPFRAGMLRAKSELMGEVAQRLRVELQRLRQQLTDGPITKEDEELIDRLRKVGAVIDELPVWPFDAGTLRRFVTAYLLPLAGAVSYPLFNFVMNRLGIALSK